jgi:hypothetical protein
MWEGTHSFCFPAGVAQQHECGMPLLGKASGTKDLDVVEALGYIRKVVGSITDGVVGIFN